MKRIWLKGPLGKLKTQPWVFKRQVKRVDSDLRAGEFCAVFSEKGQFLGSAIFNSNANVILRFYSRKEEPLDYSLIKSLVERALNYRKTHIPDEDSFRVVFGESDNLPGLIVDKYERGIVFQIHSLGLEKRRKDVIDALIDLFEPDFLLEKSESFARREEGLTNRTELIKGEIPQDFKISQLGIAYRVDLLQGQKTGFYFDQRENRKRVEFYAKGKKKGLDLFSYTGGFTLHMLRAGVNKVYSVDRSERALEFLKENVEMNSFEKNRVITFTKDVFDFLDEMIFANEKFDVIVIDPPAFAKGKKGFEGALKGYTLLHDRALRLLEDGGSLATFTCSQAVSGEDLLMTVERAAEKLGKNLFVLEILGQPEDHPILLGFPPSHYLKGFILQTV